MTQHSAIQSRAAEAGFSLVELLLAMAVFSFMLLIITAGFINVVRIQQSGVASRSTQQSARLVLDSLMKDVRAASVARVRETGQNDALCLDTGGQTLEYAVDSNGDLRVASIGSLAASSACPVPVIDSSWRRLGDSPVKTTQFNVVGTDPVNSGLGTVMVTLTLVARSNLDVLNTDPVLPGTRCEPGSGAQFCSVTTLSSTASLRGGDGS